MRLHKLEAKNTCLLLRVTMKKKKKVAVSNIAGHVSIASNAQSVMHG